MPPDDPIVPRETHFDPRGEGAENVLKNVSRGTQDKLLAYEALLKKWNLAINLVSDSNEIWHRHILDSVQLSAYFQHKNAQVCDIGSGAGLPAVPLAIMGLEDITCIESDRRKCVFLREASRELGLNLDVRECRIEDFIRDHAEYKPDIITARALASLTELLTLVKPWLSHETICLFPKGKNWSTELAEARETWRFECETLDSVTSPESKILRLKNF